MRTKAKLHERRTPPFIRRLKDLGRVLAIHIEHRNLSYPTGSHLAPTSPDSCFLALGTVQPVQLVLSPLP